MVAKAYQRQALVPLRNSHDYEHLMANWSRSMWQNVVDRALRLLRSGPFGSHLYTVTVTVS
ncbi:hypothetical protein KIN20_030191 [Parelaphostrongylus tenuis]|uniref:Uncharacterized protein n=1 Tax=Parelaphostrongylus tenuis TaxID=148309 RepID=A0AAD5R3F2_PARTN|nr:hypothetical protein KIN20_030191 [Parelaphostrongylus tenuis]